MKNIYVLGSLNMDMVISTPYIPKSGETLTGSGFFLNSGGKGANQAVAASKQNIKTYMIGNVGNDVFGNDLYLKMQEYKVDTTYLTKLNDVSTGVAMIMICNRDNRIVLDSGANAKITYEQIDKALENAKSGDILITQLENNIDAIYYGLHKAHEKGLVTIFNPAPAQKLEKKVFKDVNYLIVNESECEILTNINPDNQENMQHAYSYLNELGVESLIITLGKEGSICFDKNESYRIKGNKVDAIDTTAAGDTYVGTFASRLALNIPLKEALNYASIASSLTCLKKGAQQSIPTYDDVINYINK